MHRLGLCIKADIYVALMLYLWSLSYNKEVPIAMLAGNVTKISPKFCEEMYISSIFT